MNYSNCGYTDGWFVAGLFMRAVSDLWFLVGFTFLAWHFFKNQRVAK